ncbi:hypothetical protein DRN75_00375 [Nanoarchaeota archaeon]|nr:MAG: hypothetical protein DRN75_00375 [Nanoarchaeota archaeon]
MSEALVLFVIIAILFAILYAYSSMIRWIGLITIIIIGIIVFFVTFVRKYDEFERGIIFRLGRFNRVAGPGWSIVIPFFEKEYARVDVRTKMMPIQVKGFTADDISIGLNGIAYYRITEPSKAVLKIANYLGGLTNVIVSQTRDVIASLSMRELFGNLKDLNNIVRDRVRPSLWKWGIDIPMIQIREITPPDEIVKAMQQKEISAQLLQAQRFRAEAKKVTIEALGEGAKNIDERAAMYLYLKALEEIGKSSATKIVFPARFVDVLNNFAKNFTLPKGIDIDQAVEAIKRKLTGG